MPTPVDQLDLPGHTPDPTARLEVARDELDRLRSESWLVRVPLGYLVTTHHDAMAVLKDRRWHQASRLISDLAGITDEDYLARRSRPSILSAEGDEHQRLRRLVAPAFTPRSADRLRPFMREVINQLLDGVAAEGRCDLVTDVCEPYPIPIICELLGAPKDDWPLFSRWATEIFRVFDANVAQYTTSIMKAQDELDAYVSTLIADRRDRPGDDLLSHLIAAEEEGDRLSNPELIMLVEAVLLAGTDTTRNQLACALAVFATHPDQWRLLADRPDLAPRAAEESLRYLGAVRGTGRFASEEIEYRDVLFPAGTIVFPSFVAANTDPTGFDDPRVFDITAERDAPHLTLGFGLHYCLGANLARAELQEALTVMAQRMPDLRLDGEIEWKPTTVGIWGPASLPLAFEPGH